MPTRKQEKRRRKLRVHGPSADAVGAPPTGRKPPRASTTPARAPRSARAARAAGAVAQALGAQGRRSWRLHGRDRGRDDARPRRGARSLIALAETIPLVFLFVVFDLWMARKVYKRVTGGEAPAARAAAPSVPPQSGSGRRAAQQASPSPAAVERAPDA